jgi:hypothetical protein
MRTFKYNIAPLAGGGFTTGVVRRHTCTQFTTPAV